ncbi:hypothetical protein HDU96_003755 [Phlyctochytrium bullatum]|nr:hypothetical protein HDU96_003755 [Phlyctochytrium bullatum]
MLQGAGYQDEEPLSQEQHGSQDITELLDVFQNQFKRKHEKQLRIEVEAIDTKLMKKVQGDFNNKLYADSEQDLQSMLENVDSYLERQNDLTEKHKKTHEKRIEAASQLLSEMEESDAVSAQNFEDFVGGILEQSKQFRHATIEVLKQMAGDVADAKKRTRTLAKKEYNTASLKEGIKMILA